MHSSPILNSSSTILMLRPAHFGSNPQTLCDNAFQSSSQSQNNTSGQISIQDQAVKQFDVYVQQLRKAGVTVIVVNDGKDIVKPDAVFPNNWFVADSQGRFILFPMKPASRRPERTNPVLEQLKKQGYQINETIDLTHSEHNNKYLQGTGSMILDHQNSIAYACKSQRTNQSLFTQFCKTNLKYKPVFFHAVDNNNNAYYHTNVIMSVCSDFVIICLESIRDQQERQMVRQTVSQSRSSKQGVMKQVVEISIEQVGNFCGNVLQVNNNKGDKIITMSSTAYHSFTQHQLNIFKKHCCQLIVAEVPTIQKYGGGGTRCMMAQIFANKQLSQ